MTVVSPYALSTYSWWQTRQRSELRFLPTEAVPVDALQVASEHEATIHVFTAADTSQDSLTWTQDDIIISTFDPRIFACSAVIRPH